MNNIALTSQQSAFLKKYGPWAVVTGASDGIGKEIAHLLAANQLNLVLVARREARLEQLSAELRSAHGIETHVVVADLATDDGVQRVHATTELLDVGLLVANAGFGTTGQFIDNAIAYELSMFNVNCRAVLLMSHHYGKRFAVRKRGGIILLSSIVAFQGVAKSANYAATKAYVQTLSEGLRVELRDLNVDVLASAPGPVETGFAETANMQMGAALQPKAVAAETLAALGRRGTVRPGWLSKLLGYGLSMLPRFGRTFIMSQVMSDMTKHQAATKPA